MPGGIGRVDRWRAGALRASPPHPRRLGHDGRPQGHSDLCLVRDALARLDLTQVAAARLLGIDDRTPVGAIWHPWDIGDPPALVADGQDTASGHSLCPAVSAELTGGDRAGILGHSDLCLVTMAGDKGILTYGHTPLF